MSVNHHLLPFLRQAHCTIFAVGLLLSVAWAQRTAIGAEPPLRINTASVQPFATPDRKGFLDLLVGEIGHRIGRTAEVNLYEGASARSLQMANDGDDDGEALRIKGQEKRFPNLVRVPEPMIVNDFVAFSAPGKPAIENFQDLLAANTGYIIGWWVFQRNLQDAQHVTTVRGADQLFSMIRIGRIDYGLYEKWQGLWTAKAIGVPVQVHHPPLVKTEMFMYLHKKHADLVPKVSAALVKMKQDGSYQTLIEKTLTPLLRQG